MIERQAIAGFTCDFRLEPDDSYHNLLAPASIRGSLMIGIYVHGDSDNPGENLANSSLFVAIFLLFSLPACTNLFKQN